MDKPARFEQQTAIITGGADGIGFAIAERLAAEGAKVCLFDINAEKAQSAAGKLGGSAVGIAIDVTDEAAVNEAVERISAELPPIAVLVNSAGMTGQTNLKSHEVDPANFRRVVALNLDGTFLMCRAVIPFMLAADYGRVLNIASIAGKEGNAGMLAYSASKAAVIGLTKTMGKDYAETGITINALAPAVVRTAMVDALPPEQVKYMTDKIPMKRCGNLAEIAATAAHIVSPENSFTTGFTYDASGGRAVY